MPNVVRNPYSNTAGNTPPSLGNGVIAVNQSDGRLFYRNAAGAVTTFSSIASYATSASFPATGASSSVLYLASDTSRIHQWTGSVYVEIGMAGNTPSHASTHATGGSDAITPASIGAAATSHTHTASQVTDFATEAAKYGPVTSVAGRTGTVTISSSDVSGLGSLATASSVAYSSLTGTPSSFSPSSHASSHAAGGSDVITPASIGAAATSHVHVAADITAATDTVLGRSASGTGAVGEIECTAFGRSLLAGVNATAGRTAFGLDTVFDGPLGTVSAPTFTFVGDTNTGMFSPGADRLNIVTGGVSRLTVAANGTINTSTDFTCGGVFRTNGTMQSTGGRSLFRAVNEPYAVGSAYSATSGFVYFGAANESATPDARISNNGGAALATFLDNGNVGIGVSSPSSRLEVNGVTSISVGSAAAPSLCFTGDLNTGIYSSGTDSLSFATNGIERVRVDSDGGMRFIGSTSGYVALHSPAAPTPHAYTLPASTGTVGQLLTTNGSGVLSWVARSPIARFTARDNHPPVTNFATLDTRNSVLVLEFDAATEESATFIGTISEGAVLTNGLTVRLWWMGDTATSGNVRWGVQFEDTGTDLDADSYDTNAQVTSAASGTSGIESVASITITTIDSLAAGDRFRLRVYRVAADATNDTMTGDAQLVAVEVRAA